MKAISDRDAYYLERGEEAELYTPRPGDIDAIERLLHDGYMRHSSRGIIPSELGRIALQCWKLTKVKVNV